MFKILPCLDSVEMAASRRHELDIPRNVAAELGKSAVEAALEGKYVYGYGREVDWSNFVQAACSSKVSIPPEASLSHRMSAFHSPRHGSKSLTKQHSEHPGDSLKTD